MSGPILFVYRCGLFGFVGLLVKLVRLIWADSAQPIAHGWLRIDFFSQYLEIGLLVSKPQFFNPESQHRCDAVLKI